MLSMKRITSLHIMIRLGGQFPFPGITASACRNLTLLSYCPGDDWMNRQADSLKANRITKVWALERVPSMRELRSLLSA